MFLHGETVARVRAGTVTDPYSQESRLDWSTATETPLPGLWAVEPRPVGEPTQDARNAVTSGFTLYGPPGVDLTPADRVRVRGDVYEVDGEVAAWRNPFSGWEPGVVVQTKRVEG